MKNIFIAMILMFSIISCNKDNKNNSKLAPVQFVSSKAGLSLRANPDKSAQALMVIPYGEMVNVLKEEGNEIFMDGRYGKWVNVKTGEKTGWAFSGFLCEFNLFPVIQKVADYYRIKYSQVDYLAKYEEYTKFEDNRVSIENILDNYILLKIPMTDRTSVELSSGNVVWKYDVNLKQFSEVYNVGHGNTTHLLYLDNDKYPDLVVEDGCCSSPDMHILLGSAKGFINVYEMKDDCGSDEYFELDIGQCDAMKFRCSKTGKTTKIVNVKSTKVTLDEETEVLNHFKFSCDKKRIEKYAEGRILHAGGIITALDIKGKTIVINDEGDNQLKSLMLSDKTYVSGKTAKALTDLSIGEDVGCSYESLDGKDTAIHIYSQKGWGSHPIDGVVIAVDASSKQLALKDSYNIHIYTLADNVKIKNEEKRPVDDLKLNERIEIYLVKRKVDTILTKGIELNGSVVSIDRKRKKVIILSNEGDSGEYTILDNASIRLYNRRSTIADFLNTIEEGKKIKILYSIGGEWKYIKSIQVFK